MAAVTMRVPAISEGFTTGEVITLLVTVGDTVHPGQVVVELDTDKAVVEVPASEGGIITALHVHAGDMVAVGQPLVTITHSVVETPEETLVTTRPVLEPPDGPEGETPSEDAPQLERPATPGQALQEPAPDPPVVPVPATPTVRRLARELGVDLAQVRGSGPGGRITREDVLASAQAQTSPPPVPDRVPSVERPEHTPWGPVVRQPMTRIRRLIADRMTEAWTTIPHVTQHDQADLTAFEQLRQRYAAHVQDAGGKLTLTALVLKALAAALQRFSGFNASVDMTTHEVLLKQYYHIGVAVDTPEGLVVPVIRDVNRKSLVAVAVELTQLAARARARQLTPDDMQGGTCTLTNLGALGGAAFTPIIRAPEVAILGVARSQMVPVYDASTGQFVPRVQVPLALSYDHRLIDGADAVRFLGWVITRLEDPFLLVLEG